MKKIIILLLILLPITVNAEKIDINSFAELKEAIANNETELVLNDNLIFDSSINIGYEVSIDGNSHSINRATGYLKGLFNITTDGKLTLNNITIDGGAPNWVMDYENRYYTGENETGYVRVPTLNTDSVLSTVSLITNAGNLNINNTTIENTYTSVSGSVLKGTGSITINNSTFIHNGSKTTGGCFYLTGGSLNISNSTFKNNVAGVGATSGHAGAIYASSLNLIEIKENTIFEDNFAQSNAGALYVLKSNLNITNSSFIHNMAGNDGSAIDLQSKVEGKTVLIENTTFENNHGFATTGQSMGTIYLEQWISSEEQPITLRNLVFKGNKCRTGAALADYATGGNTYVYMEKIELFDNEFGSGGLGYLQLANVKANEVNVHDNNVISGAAFYLAANITVDIENSIITNNTGSSSGIGIYQIAGTLNIKNTEISNNETTRVRGGGIFVRGYYEGYNPVLTIKDSIITGNKAVTTGGGIAIADNENVFSSVTIDDKTQIYNNIALEAGDDFSYVRDNDSINTSNNSITLGNISLSGINGLDGWYEDSVDNRYKDILLPETFDNYTNNNGQVAFYIKAGGLNNASYDGNGGSTNATSVIFKYGDTYTVADDIPTREGYEFKEWNTASDGTGTSLKSGDTYDGSDGFVLYAIWNKKEEPIVEPVSSEDPIDSNTEVNPQTSDNSIIYIIIFIISSLGLITSIINYRK